MRLANQPSPDAMVRTIHVEPAIGRVEFALFPTQHAVHRRAGPIPKLRYRVPLSQPGSAAQSKLAETPNYRFRTSNVRS
jgi:hypothetical protein